ncbi:unnamed protein product, partial [Scytosiphon promiscuus]
MFEAVETISRVKPVSGRRLAIVATGGSLAMLAADQLQRQGGLLAEPQPDTAAALAASQRPGHPTSNPLCLCETAGAEAYAQAAGALLADRNVDAVLAVVAPSAFTSLEAAADALANVDATGGSTHHRRKPLLVALTAGAPLPRKSLDRVRIPCHGSGSEAVRAFMHLVRYADGRDMLMAAPPSLPADFQPNAEAARDVVRAALSRGQEGLTPPETGTSLAAYGTAQGEARPA